MRLVLDTNVVASALLWGGMPRTLLQSAREKRIELVTSLPLLAELMDILGRPKFDAKIAASMLSIDELVDRYRELATVVRPTPVSGVASDPDDDIVIGTGLAAEVDMVVTGDRPLLSLIAYKGMRIVSVAEAAVLAGITRQ